MGIWVLEGKLEGCDAACMVCGTSGVALGPVFDDADEIESFLAYLREHDIADPRKLTDKQLDDAHTRWLAVEGTRDVLDVLSQADTEPAPARVSGR